MAISSFVAKKTDRYVFTIQLQGCRFKGFKPREWHCGCVALFDEQSQTLTDIDSSSRIMTHHMNIDSRSPVWEAKKPVFEHRAGVAFDQALGNDGLTRTLVCSARVDTLCLYHLTGTGSLKHLVERNTAFING